MKLNRKIRTFIRIQIILGSLLICGVPQMVAQNQTSSPYSRFGIGDISRNYFGRNMGMGGINYGMRSALNVNFGNPASYTSIDTLSFLFEFGMSNKTGYFQTNDLSKTVNDANFAYMGMNFPITKWYAASIGVMPFSSVGYKIQDDSQVVNLGESRTYQGSGGISRFVIGNSVTLFNRLSLGANFNYYFGALDQFRTLSFPTDSLCFDTHSGNNTFVSDVGFDFGLQYQEKLKNNWKFTIGGVYSYKTALNARNTQLVTKNSSQITDTVFYQYSEDLSIDIPESYGFGFTVGKENSILFGFDYTKSKWSDAQFLGEQTDLVDSDSYNFGIEYVPDAGSITSYSKRMRYRFGGHYRNTYLMLNGHQLKDYGLTFGVGLPLRNGPPFFALSGINISLEIGTRGTLQNNLIRELYGILNINLSLHDVWFYKPKID